MLKILFDSSTFKFLFPELLLPDDLAGLYLIKFSINVSDILKHAAVGAVVTVLRIVLHRWKRARERAPPGGKSLNKSIRNISSRLCSFFWSVHPWSSKAKASVPVANYQPQPQRFPPSPSISLPPLASKINLRCSPPMKHELLFGCVIRIEIIVSLYHDS